MSTRRPRYDYDVAIIGGGSGGYAAARTAAGAGLKTVAIEGGEEVGGLCILRGCMPTKALLYAAEVMHLASHPQAWGISAEKVGFDFGKVMARKDTLIREFADYREKQLTGGKFGFVRAMARFADEHTVELNTEVGRALRCAPSAVEDAADSKASARSRRAAECAPYQTSATSAPMAEKRLTARHFVIATGSVVAPSPLPQLDTLDCLTSDTALKLKQLPESLIVLGGGAVAVELAQFFARFRVRVTLIQRSAHILRDLDDDAVAELEKVFRREGITLHTGTNLLDARRDSGQKEVAFDHEGKVMRVAAEEVLFALGRVPNVAGLGLERIGVKVEGGRVVTDARMQTSQPHIYAVGDCTGLHEIVHIAIQQGEVAAHNVAHPDAMKEMDDRMLVQVIFTEPQAATVGLTEKQALARKITYRAASYPFNDHGKSLIMEAKDGFVKLLADPVSGEILGGACVGPMGGELIHEIVAAMQKRMTVQELAAMPHYHPTLAEIWTYPAEELADALKG